eukprot:GGOE01014344.1.p1 GENE.GGOE01014344.1~~GGOE01014344.1.p1  ORF type:complete len:242 (-),score=57.56 GGOE01014344.1:239-892(-)
MATAQRTSHVTPRQAFNLLRPRKGNLGAFARPPEINTASDKEGSLSSAAVGMWLTRVVGAATVSFAAAVLVAISMGWGRDPAPGPWTALATEGEMSAAQEDTHAKYAEALTKGVDLVQKAISAHRVILFMKGVPKAPLCGYSAGVVDILNCYPDVKWVACDVLQDPMIREAVKHVGNWDTLPQLYVDGALIGGFDVVGDLHGRHELRDILKGPEDAE